MRHPAHSQHVHARVMTAQSEDVTKVPGPAEADTERAIQ